VYRARHRPHLLTHRRLPIVHLLRHAKVNQLDVRRLAVDEDVVGFEVAVADAETVDLDDCLEEFFYELRDKMVGTCLH
jgi:hypothetical protein